MRNRKVKKIGGSLFIQLLKADIDDFGIVEGDKINLEDLFNDFLIQKKRGTKQSRKQ